MQKMSVLWSPRAETAWESLMTVSRMLAPWPRRLSAAVLTNAPSGAEPARLGGLQRLRSASPAAARKSSHSTGTAVRSCGITAPSAIAGPPV